jgi:hypothetical protein
MHGACMRRAALPPGFLLLLAGVIAGPQQRLVLGEPVAECVALVAAPRAADQALLRRAGQPAQQRTAARVGPHQVIAAFRIQLNDEMAGRFGVRE